MPDNDHPEDRWKRVVPHLRQGLPSAEPDSSDPPLGFSSRIAAHAAGKLTRPGQSLARWRRWTLAGAACSAALLLAVMGLDRTADTPASQFLPVPNLDLPGHFPTP